jgi:hypothetical protein
MVSHVAFSHAPKTKQGIRNTLALPIDKTLYMCILCMYTNTYINVRFICMCLYNVHICVYTCVITLRLLCFRHLFPTICKVNVSTTFYFQIILQLL